MKITNMMLTTVLVMVMASCNNETVITPLVDDPSENEVISGTISSNTIWTADKIWELANKVVVAEGIVLTIEPGTIVKGRTGTGSLASALLVARGGKIMAVGTSDRPIIFTSIEDNIELGQLSGTNLSEEDRDKWGGLIILGKAPISAENGDTETQIEGIPPEDSFGLYGGSDVGDNSGVLKYVSIRHGGAEIGAGNEINGLTLGGVGSGTTIDYVEVFATLDDGIELFGGTVNISNLLISYQGDDGVDIDQNYAGTINNFIVMHGGSVTDEGLEIDGPEGITNNSGFFELTNGSVMSLGGADGGTPADLKSKAQGIIQNVVFSGYAAGDDLIKVRASYKNDCQEIKEDAWEHLTVNRTLQLTNNDFIGIEVYTKSMASDGSTSCLVSDADQISAVAFAVPASSVAGADATVFESWTIASIMGKI